MRILIFSIVLALSAQTSQAEDMSAEQSAVLGQEEAWASALLAGRLDIVDELMHRDFRLVRAYSDEPPITKEM